VNGNPFLTLSDASLIALAVSLREGALSKGLSRRVIEQITGSEAASVANYLENLAQTGMKSEHIAHMADAILQTRRQSGDQAVIYDLVLSGPEVEGVPTADTAAVVQTLISEAKEEILLVGYAIHNGKKLFEPLMARMRDDSSLRVIFCLNIGRPFGDTSLESEIVRRFLQEFRTKHWPWPNLPELWYDPRALAEAASDRASLHAKCVIVDRKAAIITSANFTEAAQRRNIEVGMIIRYEPTIRRLTDYFLALVQSNQLVQITAA
jgi:phosphatidylserine/phosphatidylglycerophosphate/cardiolipin synthase-like enzyme